jgi:hypothetical protein
MYHPLALFFTLYTVFCIALPLVTNYDRHISTLALSARSSPNNNVASLEVARSKLTLPASNAFGLRLVPTKTFSVTRSEQDESNTQSIQAGTSGGSATTTSSAPIATKTNVDGCNQQGIATALLLANQWGSTKASDVLECQRRCMSVSQCISYSFRLATTVDDFNCVFYHMFTASGTNAVVPSEISGIFFSDKYPKDGSNFCYAGVSST